MELKTKKLQKGAGQLGHAPLIPLKPCRHIKDELLLIEKWGQKCQQNSPQVCYVRSCTVTLQSSSVFKGLFHSINYILFGVDSRDTVCIYTNVHNFRHYNIICSKEKRKILHCLLKNINYWLN